MLTKSQILDAIKKSLGSYNGLVTSQITEKINAHNTAATATAQGHMTADMVKKLNGIATGAEVNQNAIAKIQIDKNVMIASGKESTAVFKASNGVSVAFDDTNAITISGTAASTSAVGVVQLDSATDSTSTTKAATASAVKSAYDKAASAQSDLDSYKNTVTNTYMPKSGGTFTGEVILKADPTKALGAATMQYVDNKASNYMPKSGGAFTGAITLSGAPTADLHATTKKYVDDTAAAAAAKVVDSAPETLNTLNELATALGNDANFATTVSNQIGTKVDKVNGKGLSTNDYTTDEKNKLGGIAQGAEVNQNAFSNVKVGTTTIDSGAKTATLELAAGSNVTLTADASGKKVTIAATDITYGVASSGADGLMSKGDKAKLDQITIEAGVTDDEIATMIAVVQTAINS